MKRFLAVAGMLVAMSGVGHADIADREHDDANTKQARTSGLPCHGGPW